MKKCIKCGAEIEENARFCKACGHDQNAPVKKKKGKGIAITIIILLLLSGIGFGVYYFYLKDRLNPNPPVIENSPNVTPSSDVSASNRPSTSLPDVSYTIFSKSPEAVIDITSVDSVYPSNYRSLEALLTFTGYCDYGEMDVIIEVEVPGFTQVYRQKITLGRQVSKLRIIPPLITGDIDLNSEKTAQIVYSVTDAQNNKILVQESKNIRIHSRYDMVWSDGISADAYTDNILAWLTPDAQEIVNLKRDAIDYLGYISDGALEMLVGYQDMGLGDLYFNTWVQAVALQGAISDIAQVRYNNSMFSMDSQQRVLLPADVLRTRSGVCIETVMLMASALQSAGMNCMLIFPPGHAQLALEVWPYSGEYFLIETTILPMEMSYDGWDSVVMYLDKDQWLGYLSGEGRYTLGPCYVVDCDLGSKLGIRAMSN